MVMLKILGMKLVKSLDDIFGLSDLDYQESVGVFKKNTYFKFLRYSKLHVPFALGRTIRGISFSHSVEDDPFGYFCKGCTTEEHEESLGNYLINLYEQERAKTAADIVGLGNKSSLSKYPAWALVMPWENISPEYKLNTYLHSFARNRNSNNLSFDQAANNLSEEILYTKANANSQVRQTKKLWQSIKENGYKSSMPLPRILIFVSDNQWRWVMSGSGNHRAYLCNIGGYESLLVEIHGIIDRRHAWTWFNVKNRIYTEEEALGLFDSFFNGKRVLRGVV